MARQIIHLNANVDDNGNFHNDSGTAIRVLADDRSEIGTFASYADYQAWRLANEPETVMAERAAQALVQAAEDAREAAYKARMAEQRAASAAKTARNPFGPRD